MRLGVLRISPQLITSPYWDVIAKTLANHFTEIERKFDPWTNAWLIVGESEHFDELQEGELPHVYVATFETLIEGLPLFLDFQKA